MSTSTASIDRAPTNDKRQSGGGKRGWVKVPHAMTSAKISDAALRLWLAIQQWTWNGKVPTNAELATACGWVAESGYVLVEKVKEKLRELEAAGYIRRDNEAIGHRRRR